MTNVGEEPLHQGSAMVDTSGTDQGFHANLRNAPTILPLWDTATVQSFAAWDLKLRTNVDIRTFNGFIDSTRPSLEEAKRITRTGGDVRLADIQASIDLWDKHDGFLFTVLLNSTVLTPRQNKHWVRKAERSQSCYDDIKAHPRLTSTCSRCTGCRTPSRSTSTGACRRRSASNRGG
jgi:hypothetical protein